MSQQDECTVLHGSMKALYERYAQPIFAYARLHTSSWEDAEDLTIEVFLVAFEHDNLSWLTEKQQFVWLRQVAHNKFIDHYRRTARSSLLPLEQVVETLSQNEAQTPEQLILRREALTQLYRAVERLPLLQRQVLQLRFGDGLLFAEIAILLNKKEEAVRKLSSRTLARLRRIYHQQEGETAL
jgi:RNA polymerase sigma factor (sigma-70 family)